MGLGSMRRFSRWRRSNGWKIGNVGNELPGLLIGELPARHPGVPNAIANQIKKLAGGSSGRSLAAKIGRRWIQAAARFGFSKPVVAVADFAILVIQLPTRRHI